MQQKSFLDIFERVGFRCTLRIATGQRRHFNPIAPFLGLVKNDFHFYRFSCHVAILLTFFL